MSKHTRGPWTIEDTKDGQYERIQSHGYVIAWTGHKDFGSLPEHKANAALIAAAPELLEACKSMIARLENLTSDDFHKGREKAERERMIAAIAAAEGRK